MLICISMVINGLQQLMAEIINNLIIEKCL
jgi:hypothetical protein